MIRTPVWFESARDMSLGLMLPVREGTMGGETPRFDDLVAMSKQARDVGFEALWFGDHLSYQQDGHTVGTWEAWTLMAAIANAVPEVQIGPLVTSTGYRNPGLIAKMTEMIDEISGGRFILGIGAGWAKPEYEQFGIPYSHRASRFEESIAIIHDLLRQGEASLDGEYWQAREAINEPRGPRSGGAPILVGSNGDRLVHSIARYADAWNSDWQQSPDDYPPLLAKLDAACEQIGRQPKSLIRTGSVRFTTDTSTDGIQRYLNAVRELGLKHLVVGLEPRTIDAVSWFGEQIAIFDAT